MKYKLICADVDGTLVDDNGRIPQKNVEAIRRLQEQGGVFAICSGRLYNAADILAKSYGISCYIVSCNGGAVVNNENDEVIEINNIAMEKREKLAEIADKYNCVVGLSRRDGICYRGWDGDENMIYAAANDLYSEKAGKSILIEQTDNYRERMREEELVKFSLWARSEEDFEKVKEEIRNMGNVTTGTALRWQQEVTEENVSKWSGVQCLMKLYGIRREEVICIGDSMNDYEMVKNAGLGVAMANGMEEIKKYADYIADTNNNAGVAQIIDLCLADQL